MALVTAYVEPDHGIVAFASRVGPPIGGSRRANGSSGIQVGNWMGMRPQTRWMRLIRWSTRRKPRLRWESSRMLLLSASTRALLRPRWMLLRMRCASVGPSGRRG